MYVKFDRVADGGKDNKGSCADFIHYMMKEDNRNNDSVEWWFDQDGKLQMSRDVQDNIDKDHHKLGRHRAKFSTGSISPSVREWAAMGANEQERRENFKQWAAAEFTKGFAANFRKHGKNGKPIEITPDNVKIYFKFEAAAITRGRTRNKPMAK